MDHQPVGGQVCGKFRAAGPGKGKIFSGKFPDPFRQFFRSDVAALAVVGAAFGDEDTIAVLQSFQGGNAHDGLFQIPFVPGH